MNWYKTKEYLPMDDETYIWMWDLDKQEKILSNVEDFMDMHHDDEDVINRYPIWSFLDVYELHSIVTFEKKLEAYNRESEKLTATPELPDYLKELISKHCMRNSLNKSYEEEWKRNEELWAKMIKEAGGTKLYETQTILKENPSRTALGIRKAMVHRAAYEAITRGNEIAILPANRELLRLCVNIAILGGADLDELEKLLKDSFGGERNG